ncbi:TrmH family RNA methyltransferase [Clostridium sp. WILCCON 0269]|uniref:TrmH family RNA methyltransferase n=1 Tax=Candidatus Clostridium eludens TaxID=3381663 RepID=A0ABW8SEX2_9CLOT
MDIIRSKDNSHVKEAKKLKEKKYRVQRKEFMIEGFRFVKEAINSDFEISEIFLSHIFINREESFFLEESLQVKCPIYFVTDEILRSISGTENPQGIIALVKNKELNVKDEEGFYILADKIQDPGNMGTIIRSAHASGALGIITTKGTVDVYNEKTLRSTMGSIFYIPVIEDEDLQKVKFLKQTGFKLISSSLRSDINFYNINLRGKIIIAVGNEGSGLGEDVREIADMEVSIPMPGKAESLNAAVAASIMMFEIVRQKLS